MCDRCIYCGWTRENMKKKVGFFALPSEPGGRRLAWTRVIGNVAVRAMRKRDKVCSLHFQSGRPSLNPKSVDYVPNRFLMGEAADETFENSYKVGTVDKEAKKRTEKERISPIPDKTKFPELVNLIEEPLLAKQTVGPSSSHVVQREEFYQPEESENQPCCSTSNESFLSPTSSIQVAKKTSAISANGLNVDKRPIEERILEAATSDDRISDVFKVIRDMDKRVKRGEGADVLQRVSNYLLNHNTISREIELILRQEGFLNCEIAYSDHENSLSPVLRKTRQSILLYHKQKIEYWTQCLKDPFGVPTFTDDAMEGQVILMPRRDEPGFAAISLAPKPLEGIYKNPESSFRHDLPETEKRTQKVTEEEASNIVRQIFTDRKSRTQRQSMTPNEQQINTMMQIKKNGGFVPKVMVPRHVHTPQQAVQPPNPYSYTLPPGMVPARQTERWGPAQSSQDHMNNAVRHFQLESAALVAPKIATQIEVYKRALVYQNLPPNQPLSIYMGHAASLKGRIKDPLVIGNVALGHYELPVNLTRGRLQNHRTMIDMHRTRVLPLADKRKYRIDSDTENGRRFDALAEEHFMRRKNELICSAEQKTMFRRRPKDA